MLGVTSFGPFLHSQRSVRDSVGWLAEHEIRIIVKPPPFSNGTGVPCAGCRTSCIGWRIR